MNTQSHPGLEPPDTLPGLDDNEYEDDTENDPILELDLIEDLDEEEPQNEYDIDRITTH